MRVCVKFEQILSQDFGNTINSGRVVSAMASPEVPVARPAQIFSRFSLQ